jgi:hypothetical protein
MKRMLIVTVGLVAFTTVADAQCYGGRCYPTGAYRMYQYAPRYYRPYNYSGGYLRRNYSPYNRYFNPWYR